MRAVLIDMALGKAHGLARGAPLFERNPGSPDLRNRDQAFFDRSERAFAVAAS
jgi:hypothetical protein